MTFVRTPATPRKHFGSALSSLGPPFPPFGLPANQESFHFYLGSSTFWEPAQQGASGDFAEDVKATPLRIRGGSVVDGQMTATPPGGQHIGVPAALWLLSPPPSLLWCRQSEGREIILNVLPLDLEANFDDYLEFVHSAVDDATAFLNDLKPIHVTDGF